MKNFVKISILTLLAVFSVVCLLIYNEKNIPIFAFISLISFVTLILISISAFAQDITKTLDKLRHNRSLQKNIGVISNDDLEISWQRFVENNSIPSISFDQELNIIRKNIAFVELLKKNNINPDARNLADSFSCDVGKFRSVMISTNYSKSIEGKATLNNAYKTPFVFFSVPVNDDNNKRKIFFAQFVDDSENMELKEKFIQAQKMQAIGQLAGGIAHDFNNLLTAIGGFCDLLLTRHAPGDASFVDIMHIKQNANRAASLVKQLLAFSRKQTMQMEVLHISDVLTEISNLIKRLIGENISLKVEHERDVWDVKADKSQLEQVLINLAVNARDAIIGKREGRLNIKCNNIEIFSADSIKFKYPNFISADDIIPGKYVMISFTDNGCGIPTENLKKIFEPFFTTKSVGQGTGLGLATVIGIIEQTGGHLYVSSQENEGTEFIIFLKRYEKPSSEMRSEQVKTDKTKDLTGSGTIMIVEDEDAVRMFSSRALRNKGYNVIEAYNGENALEVFEKIGGQNIDLIISDVVMPGLSGPEFVEKISAKYPDIKVVFVSGYGEDAFYQKYGLERKFNFLPKPYSLNQLAEKVKEFL